MGRHVLHALGSEGVVAQPDGFELRPPMGNQLFDVFVNQSAVAHAEHFEVVPVCSHQIAEASADGVVGLVMGNLQMKSYLRSDQLPLARMDSPLGVISFLAN